jgi:hypothetical protein
VRRIHLFELEDQAWFPRVIRDAAMRSEQPLAAFEVVSRHPLSLLPPAPVDGTYLLGHPGPG